MHTSSSVTLAVAVFLASAVESVEAVTIIVAAGVSRGWRSALEGAAAALAVLVVLVGALGPALVYLVPISVLRTVVGALLLVFGLQWLRKAILRTVGLKAKHDEDAIFQEQVEALTVGANGSASATGLAAPGLAATGLATTASSRPKRDATGFAVAFKGHLPRRPGDRHHRPRPGRRQPPIGSSRRRRFGRHRGGGHHRRHRRPPAGWRTRKRHEDRGRPHARLLRDVLGRRGARRQVAGV